MRKVGFDRDDGAGVMTVASQAVELISLDIYCQRGQTHLAEPVSEPAIAGPQVGSRQSPLSCFKLGLDD